VVDVTDRADVEMRLRPLELLLGHRRFVLLERVIFEARGPWISLSDRPWA
jgi:hypothetical protein